MNNKLYDGQRLNDFRELVNLYKTKYKDLTAFEYKASPEDSKYISVKYSKFAEDIENLACSLLEQKCKKVALISDNRYEWCVSYLAITTAGLIVVPLDKSLPDNELKSLLVRSDADTVIFSKKYLDSILFSNCNTKICMDKVDDNDNILYYYSLIGNGANLDHSEYNKISIDNKSLSIILFTSGTTSKSKAVMLSQYAICMDMYALSQMIDITTDYKYIQKNLVEYKVTGFVCVPLMLEVMYKKILKTINVQNKTLLVNIMRFLFRSSNINTKRKVFKSIIDGFGGKLKTIISGGAPIDKATIKGYNDFGFDVHQGYGLTETAPVIAGENIFNKRIGSVGFPLPGIEIKVDNPDLNGIGELIVKTPTIMLGYADNEIETDKVIKDDYFYTGDLGYIDKDGFVFITGRKKDMIVLKNGKKIFPEELETLINKLPYVTESMVFGSLDNTKSDRNVDINLCAKIIYDKDELIKVFPKINENEYHNIIWNEIKEINKTLGMI